MVIVFIYEIMKGQKSRFSPNIALYEPGVSQRIHNVVHGLLKADINASFKEFLVSFVTLFDKGILSSA